jgi:predicted DNA binding CopG/RHH family protein
MSIKTASFKSAPTPTPSVKIWVHQNKTETSSAPCEVNTTIATPPAEIMKRFTIDVSEDLHKRIKAQCAMRGAKMADVMREILEQKFPK